MNVAEPDVGAELVPAVPAGFIVYLHSFLPTYVRWEIDALCRRGAKVWVILPDSSPRATMWDAIASADEVVPWRTSVVPTSCLLPVPLDVMLGADGEPGQDVRAENLYMAAASRLADVVAGEPIARVHAHFAKAEAQVGVRLARLLGVPFSVTTHSNDIFVPREPAALGALLRKASAILTISHFNHRYLASRFGEDVGRRTHVVHLGVPIDALPARTRSSAPPLSVVCTASGLGETKGIPTLIEACAILKRRGVAVRCTIAGSDLAGTAAGELRAAVAAAGLENEVIVAGLIPSPDWLPRVAAADVFVLPCVQAAGGGMDGIPVSLIEAMGMGVPVITTAVSGIPELVREGRTGLVVPPGDPAAVADALEWVRTRPAAAERIGTLGRRFVARYFSSAASANALLSAWAHPVSMSTRE